MICLLLQVQATWSSITMNENYFFFLSRMLKLLAMQESKKATLVK